MMMRRRLWLSTFALTIAIASSALAHEISFSHAKLRYGNPLDVSLELPVRDLAQALGLSPPQLLEPAVFEAQKLEIERLIAARFTVSSGNQRLSPQDFALEPITDARNLRVSFALVGPTAKSALLLNVNLFPANNLNKTFVDVYNGPQLERQVIFDAVHTTVKLEPASREGVLEVIASFVLEGIHHIFIGPDHILFVIGLLLLGGNILQLLKIVSAFTLAHSVTLILATLQILNPPANIIEPAIAASIVFVGVHSLLSKNTRDLRVWFALLFGLIHGFGFANALGEMQLPKDALAWSLLAFNLGVEAGQMCIVLTVAPLLALMRSKLNPLLSARIIGAASIGVIAAGAFWFTERVTSG